MSRRFIIVKTALDEGERERFAWATEAGYARYRATCGEANVDAFVWAVDVPNVKRQVLAFFPDATFSDEDRQCH